MYQEKDSTTPVQDQDAELIEALTEEAREKLAAKGSLVPVTDDDGTITYQMPSGFNRLFAARRQRRD